FDFASSSAQQSAENCEWRQTGLYWFAAERQDGNSGCLLCDCVPSEESVGSIHGDRESGSWKSSFQRRLSYVRNRPAHRLQVVKPLDVFFSSHSGFQSGRCDGPAVNRRILVAYASQFGSTEEIAQAIF